LAGGAAELVAEEIAEDDLTKLYDPGYGAIEK